MCADTEFLLRYDVPRFQDGAPKPRDTFPVDRPRGQFTPKKAGKSIRSLAAHVLFVHDLRLVKKASKRSGYSMRLAAGGCIQSHT